MSLLLELTDSEYAEAHEAWSRGWDAQVAEDARLGDRCEVLDLHIADALQRSVYECAS